MAWKTKHKTWDVDWGLEILSDVYVWLIQFHNYNVPSK